MDKVKDNPAWVNAINIINNIQFKIIYIFKYILYF